MIGTFNNSHRQIPEIKIKQYYETKSNSIISQKCRVKCQDKRPTISLDTRGWVSN